MTATIPHWLSKTGHGLHLHHECDARGYAGAALPGKLGSTEFFIERSFSRPAVLYINDTYQFSDYSKYMVECFSEQEKALQRETQFPLDCQKAFELGRDLARG